VDRSGAPVSGALVLFQRTHWEQDIVCSKQGCRDAESEGRFEEKEDRKVLLTYTDANGLYTIKVPVGKGFGIVPWYHVSVMASGYHPECEEVSLPEVRQKSITARATLKKAEAISHDSQGTGKLKLKVLDQSGAIFQGLRVLTRRNSDPINSVDRDNPRGIQIGETTSIGELETELPPGSYDVVLPSVGVCHEATMSSGKTTELIYKVGWPIPSP